MIKTIGLIQSKNDKKVFFLPKEVKKIVDHGYHVFCHKNYGQHLNISDNEYANNGAKILSSPNEVVAASEIILLTSNIAKLKKSNFKNKIVICLSNYLNNLLMLECFMHQKVSAIQWILSNNAKHFEIFNKLEKIKNKYILDFLKQQSALPIKNIVLINDTIASLDLAQILLNQKYNIKLLINKNFFHLTTQSKHLQQISKEKNINFEMVNINPETFYDNLNDADAIIHMKYLPEKIVWKLFTNESIKFLTKKTILLDMASENGFCATFIKKYTKPFCLKKFHNVLYSAPYDITNNYAFETSQCISLHSVDLFIEMLQKDTFKKNDLLITKDGDVVHPMYLKYLHFI